MKIFVAIFYEILFLYLCIMHTYRNSHENYHGFVYFTGVHNFGLMGTLSEESPVYKCANSPSMSKKIQSTQTFYKYETIQK